ATLRCDAGGLGAGLPAAPAGDAAAAYGRAALRRRAQPADARCREKTARRFRRADRTRQAKDLASPATNCDDSRTDSAVTTTLAPACAKSSSIPRPPASTLIPDIGSWSWPASS